VVAAAVAAPLWADPAAGGGDADEPAVRAVLQHLESRLAEVKTVQTAFRQERHLAVFAQTVTLEGRIVLENPGRLAWHVDKPVPYAMVMSDSEVAQWDEASGKVQHTSLAANPVLQAVAEQLRTWFAGRYTSLAETYDVAIERQHPCVLAFRPRAGSPVAKAIQKVTVGFREDERYVREIGIEETGGDRTTIVFTDTVLNAPVDATAWEVKPRAE